MLAFLIQGGNNTWEKNLCKAAQSVLDAPHSSILQTFYSFNLYKWIHHLHQIRKSIYMLLASPLSRWGSYRITIAKYDIVERICIHYTEFSTNTFSLIGILCHASASFLKKWVVQHIQIFDGFESSPQFLKSRD
jgi:hypothetical protein